MGGTISQQVILDEVPMDEVIYNDGTVEAKKKAIKQNMRISLLKQAKEHFDKKEYNKALVCMDKLIKNNIVKSLAYMRKAFFYYSLDEFTKSIECAQKCLEEFNEDIDPEPYKFCCYLLIIKSYCVKQFFIEAYRYYAKALIEYYRKELHGDDSQNFFKQIRQIGMRLVNIDMDEGKKKQIDLELQEKLLKINEERKANKNEELYVSDIRW